MYKLMTTMLAFGMVAASQPTEAGGTAVACHGCNSWAKENAARAATSRGKVFVFDAENVEVATYSVHTELLDLRRRHFYREARKVRPDKVLQARWEDYIEAREDVIEYGTINLPQDSEIRSVAGALADPEFASTTIEQYLAEYNHMARLLHTANNVLTRFFQIDLGVIDLKEVVPYVTVKVEFPDGSTMDMEVNFSFNPGNSNLRLELRPAGNAIDSQGRAVPTQALGLRGRTYRDNNGSLQEWMFYARQIGAQVGGARSGSGATMECRVSGSTVYCEVRLAK